MNEPTPEEIKRVEDIITRKCFYTGDESLFTKIAKWHLAQFTQVAAERDAALRQGEIYRQETLRWSEADKVMSAELNNLRRALIRIANYPIHSEPVGGAMAMQDIAVEALKPEEAKA